LREEGPGGRAILARISHQIIEKGSFSRSKEFIYKHLSEETGAF
jgi:hypothetical protein